MLLTKSDRINDFIKAAKNTNRGVVLKWRVNLGGAMLEIILVSNFSGEQTTGFLRGIVFSSCFSWSRLGHHL